MPSKFDRLRAGEVVEIEPGRKGRLNLENKSFETSDGRTMYVGDDPDFFPSDDNQLAYSREKEGLSRQINKTPGGEFLYQFGNQGAAGAVKDWYNKLTKKGDDYLRTKQVGSEVSQEISESSPWTSTAATAASFIPDIALTKGMSAAKAAPTLAALHAGPRIIEEPEQVAGEAALSAMGGYLIDKGANALNKIAQRRGQVRSLPGEKISRNEQNLAQNEQFNALKQQNKSLNEQKLQKYQSDLNARQNQIIKEQNDYAQKKIQRDSEVLRLKNKAELEKAERSANYAKSDAEFRAAEEIANQENKRMAEKFKLDQAQYEKDLANLPNLQREAQREFSENVIKNAEAISNSFPKNSRILSTQFGVNNFIEESIQKSAIAGSKEANQSSRILRSLFPEGESLTSKELASRYKSLEGAIQKAAPETAEILTQFKNHMGDRLPNILADNIAYSRVVPSLRTQVEKDVMSILESMPLAERGVSSRAFLKSQAKKNIDNFFVGLNPAEFMQKMQNGEIREQILRSVMNPNDFAIGGLSNLSKTKKLMPVSTQEAISMGATIPPKPSQIKYEEFSGLLSNKLDKALAKAELKMIATDIDASKKLGSKVRNTYGKAQPVNPPNAPIPPEPIPSPVPPTELPPVAPVQLPPPIQPPNTPPIPQKPILNPEPIAPMPLPEPTLAPAQGMADRMGDLLEKPILGTGKGITDNPLVKLGGLKYLLGKATVPTEAAYLGMRGLTSPTAGGEIARMSFKQGGIQAIDMMAQKYPSYRNGILENPQDRRSLTKEVEDDSEIPIEQKAVIQSKINRGKPLQERL